MVKILNIFKTILENVPISASEFLRLPALDTSIVKYTSNHNRSKTSKHNFYQKKELCNVQCSATENIMWIQTV